jgi:hypothetical protein
MKTIFAALAILAALATRTAATEAWDHSANYYLPSCRAFANEQFATGPFRQGECVGILEALAMMASNMDKTLVASSSCTPDDVTFSQMTTVVVRWLDQHPQRWHEDFRVLALLALHDAWPCK